MTIPQRILWQVALGAGLVIAVATGVTYEIVYREAKDRDLDHLETYVRERARREELGFQQVQANLTVVRGQFLRRMEGPNPRNIEGQWNERFNLFPDGAWRSRTNFVDGRRYSTLWAHRNVVFNPDLKTQILRAQNICDDLLPGWVDIFPSVYFIFAAESGWMNIGFDSRIPNWVWETPADYDPSTLEWFQLALPTKLFVGTTAWANTPVVSGANPAGPRDQGNASHQRPAGPGLSSHSSSSSTRWTGVIEEPTTKVPIVSVYLPIEKDGKFLGSIGHDLFVSRLLDETVRSGLPGTMHVIFRADGRIIAHPTLRREILASKGALRMTDTGDAALAGLYRTVVASDKSRLSGYDQSSGLYFSSAKLAGPDWFFVTTVPRELLQQLAFQSAQWVLWSGLLSLALVLGFLAVTLRRQIARPLVELSRATRQMSAGDGSARASVMRRDEFGALAGSFNEMASRVAQRDAELQAEKASLAMRVAERTAELQESELRFVTAFRHSPAMQSLLRARDRVLVEVNDAFLSKLGFSREQVVGKSAGELNFWVAQEELDGFGRELESKGYVSGREVRLRAGDGQVLTVLLSTQPVDIGGIPHFLSAGVDITARKQAEARLREGEQLLRDSETRFRTVFHNSPAMQSVMRAADNVLVEVNESFLSKLGYQRKEVVGKSPFDLNPPEDLPELLTIRRRLDELGFIQNQEMRLRARDGRFVVVLLSMYPVHIDGVTHFVTAGVDITEQKRAEAELQKALLKERELSQLKSEFVSLVSHEFRTPLEIIISSADNLLRYHDRLTSEQREHLLKTINRSVRRMSGMMEEVLVLGRLETDRMKFRPEKFNLNTLCQRVCDEIRSATNWRCPIVLETTDLPLEALGDESLLRHIFSNLLSNAVKYSPEGTRVTFTVSRDGDNAICRVADRGCGIPLPDQKRLFQAFHRGSNVGQIPGTGLGLLIVQRCVALHGGELNFDSVEGEGTTFMVRLPVFNQPTAPA